MASVTQIGGYDIDIVVQGFPGKTVCHGGLGWSTIALIRGHGRIALVDTGGFGVRKLLIDELARRGLKPTDVTDLLITHAHHDHCINWPLFKDARIVVGAHELAWAAQEPWGETPVPELYVRELQTWPSVHQAADGEDPRRVVTPGAVAVGEIGLDFFRDYAPRDAQRRVFAEQHAIGQKLNLGNGGAVQDDIGGERPVHIVNPEVLNRE